DVKGSQAEFLEALRLKPRYAEAHYNLALALQKQGKDSAAGAEFEKAYAIMPELRNNTSP
ncbi:MAG TPA: tetratricopeptide repeat protein, partial [Candidatus Acidoferrum sp.]